MGLSIQMWERWFSAKKLEKGRELVRQGSISNYECLDRKVRATVNGSKNYKVTISFDHVGDVLLMDCSCPDAAEGNNCKHCAAVLSKYISEKPIEPNMESAKTVVKPSQNKKQEQMILPEINGFRDMMHICDGGKTQCVISDKPIEIVNLIDYTREGNRYTKNTIPMFIEGATYYEIGELSSCIRELLSLDYSAILIPSNFKNLQSAEITAAQDDYERFKHICNLFRYEGVMKLLAHAVPRNKDGSLKKRAVTPIAYTKFNPVSFGGCRMSPDDYYCTMLVAKNTENGIQLEIRCKELVSQVEEDLINPVKLPVVSADLIEKVLQLGQQVK